MTFLDTNVCLDLLTKRSPWHQSAETIIRYHLEQSMEIGISIISIPTIAYLLEKHHPNIEISEVLENIFTFLDVLDVTGEMTRRALAKSWADVEDSIQHECALHNAAQVIITRNKKDFAGSEIPVFTPDEWIELFINQ